MARASKASGPISLAEFGRRHGVSAMAVSKAVRTGRLKASVVRTPNGPKIADPEKAAREWRLNTDPLRGRASVGAAESPRRSSQRRRETVEEATARLRSAQADKEEAKLAALLKRTWRAEDLRRLVADKIHAAKTKLLALPTRAKQQLPHLTTSDVDVLDAIVREALDELKGASP